MSVHYDPDRRRWIVRWRAAGRHRAKNFRVEAEARAFDASLRPPAPKAAPVGDGVYPYSTREGIRFRFTFRQSDGSVSTRRGFTSRRAAVIARRHMIESIERGEVKVARVTFGEFWSELLEERRPYLTAGAYVDTEIHGRKRLLPMLADIPLARARRGGRAALDRRHGQGGTQRPGAQPATNGYVSGVSGALRRPEL